MLFTQDPGQAGDPVDNSAHVIHPHIPGGPYGNFGRRYSITSFVIVSPKSFSLYWTHFLIGPRALRHSEVA